MNITPIKTHLEAKPDVEIDPPGNKMSKKILVVDDNKDVINALAKLLTLLEYQVSTAYDGSSAIDTARGSKPDVVLLDIGLPGMSGYEVAKALRKEMGPALILIAVSGFGQKEDKAKAHEAGFDHHLTKPVSIAEIEKLI